MDILSWEASALCVIPRMRFYTPPPEWVCNCTKFRNASAPRSWSKARYSPHATTNENTKSLNIPAIVEVAYTVARSIKDYLCWLATLMDLLPVFYWSPSFLLVVACLVCYYLLVDSYDSSTYTYYIYLLLISFTNPTKKIPSRYIQPFF